ncbi:MAG: hypothetical protein LCH56_16645, partial [Proteobacteria bacterium]|nr:hypothetical protein [Pseudomonadota bacterium]
HGTLALAYCVLFRGASAWRLAVLVAVSLIATYSWARDGALFAACFVLFLLARKDSRLATGLAITLTILVAAAALMKTTSLLLALPTVVLVDINRSITLKKPAIFTAIFSFGFLAAYAAAGQSFGALGAYLFTAFEVSRGYGEAMHVYGAMMELALFTLAGLILFALVTVQEFKSARADGLFLAAMMAGFLFVIAKSGFVRHDVGHVMIPWTALALAATAYLPEFHLSRAARAVFTGAIFTSTAACCVIYVGGAREAGRTATASNILLGDMASQIHDDTKTVGTVLFGNQVAAFEAAYQAQMASLRAQSPVPDLHGTVDIFGVNQSIAVASGADYRPRPIFQSYSVYTPDLIERNRAALTGPHAPETILLEIDTVDGRYPSLDEGALWPDLLRLYDVTRFENGYAVLKRRADPRRVDLSELYQADIGFGQEMDVTPWADGLLWMELDIRPSLLGRLRSFLFKPPMLMMTVTTDAGNTQVFRIVPGMTGSGFLLSPLVETTDQFVLLPARDESIARFSITAVGRPAGAFENQIGVRLKRLTIAGENEQASELNMATLSRLRTMRALAASAGAIPGQKKAQILPDGKALAHAPTRLSLKVPEGATELDFSYGILDGAWADGRDGDGACFRVSAGEVTLHDACLDPKRINDDRMPKSAHLALPAGTPRLFFDTIARENTDWDWTYWSEIQFK